MNRDDLAERIAIALVDDPFNLEEFDRIAQTSTGIQLQGLAARWKDLILTQLDESEQLAVPVNDQICGVSSTC